MIVLCRIFVEDEGTESVYVGGWGGERERESDRERERERERGREGEGVLLYFILVQILRQIISR